MTVRISTGLRNGLTNGFGFASMFNRGYAEVYSGSQPVGGDAAATGTKLGIVTSASGALTKETRASGTITVTGAAGGSINTVTVGGLNIIPDGAVAVVTGDTTATAGVLCDAINRNGMFQATYSGAVVTIKPRYGAGDAFNAATVTGTVTTATASYGNMASGVDPVNGLIFGAELAGVIAKLSTQIWSFNGITNGTAGWFRLYSSDSGDSGLLLSGAPWYPRLDGSCGVGSGDMQLSTLSVQAGVPVTVDQFTWTQPAA